MRTKLKRMAIITLRMLLSKPAMRTVIREAPMPVTKYKKQQLSVLKTGEVFASSPSEVARFRERIEKVEAELGTRADFKNKNFASDHRLLTILQNALKTRETLNRFLETAKNYGEAEFKRVADLINSNSNAYFQFKPGLAELFLIGVSKFRDLDILIAGLEVCPDYDTAQKLLQAYSGTLVHSAGAGEPTSTPDLLLVDNAIDLKIAEVLQRRLLKNTKVYFSNRALSSTKFKESKHGGIEHWKPIMESYAAYYTDSESDLDTAYLVWWDSVAKSIGKIFQSKGNDLLGKTGYEAFSYLLQDSSYLRFREYWAWKSVIENAIGDDSKIRVLILSTRTYYADEIFRNWNHSNAVLEMSFWSPALDAPKLKFVMKNKFNSQLSTLELHSENEGLRNYSYRPVSKQKFSQHFNVNKVGISKSTKYTIITTSAVNNYIDYSFKLAESLGVQHCTIFDVNTNGHKQGVKDIADKQGIRYAVNSHSATYETISGWEKKLTNDFCLEVIRVLKHSDIWENVITQVFLTSDELKKTSVNFIRLFAQISYTKDYLTEFPLADAESVEGVHDTKKTADDKKIVFFIPARLPVSIPLTKKPRSYIAIDVQFFMNSHSFRYKKPESDLILTIDNPERKFFEECFGLGADKTIALGSPSVDMYLKGQVNYQFDFGYDGDSLFSKKRKILVVGQPLDIELFRPAVKALKRLLESDNRYEVVLKLHPHNSHGLIEVFQAILGSTILERFSFDSGTDIYRLISESDLVLGYSSNSLIEAAAIRKGVLLLSAGFVDEFFIDRQVGLTVDGKDLDKKIFGYFEDERVRDEIRKLQDEYFAVNPGMDAQETEFDYSKKLISLLPIENRGENVI